MPVAVWERCVTCSNTCVGLESADMGTERKLRPLYQTLRNRQSDNADINLYEFLHSSEAFFFYPKNYTEKRSLEIQSILFVVLYFFNI